MKILINECGFTLNVKPEDKVLSIYTIVFGNKIIKVRKIRIFYSYIWSIENSDKGQRL